MANKNPFDLNSRCVNYTNINQGFIHITEDKLKVILLEHNEKNSQFYSWTTPLGIFSSCLLSTLTSNFENNWGLSASTWEAIFVICTLISGVWLLYSGINALCNMKGRKVDDLIERIKNNTTNSSGS